MLKNGVLDLCLFLPHEGEYVYLPLLGRGYKVVSPQDGGDISSSSSSSVFIDV